MTRGEVQARLVRQNLQLHPTLAVPVMEALLENILDGFLEPVRIGLPVFLVWAVIFGVPLRARSVLGVVGVHVQFHLDPDSHGRSPSVITKRMSRTVKE